MKTLTLTLLMALFPALACGDISPQAWASTQAAAAAHGLEPELLAALVWQESRYCADAVSPKGAVGLGQLMPDTARELGVDALDPAANLNGAARYLVAQWDTFGRWDLALAAYNAGPEAVAKWGDIPPFEETQAFVSAVLAHYRRFKAQSAVLNVQAALPLEGESGGAAGLEATDAGGLETTEPNPPLVAATPAAPSSVVATDATGFNASAPVRAPLVVFAEPSTLSRRLAR